MMLALAMLVGCPTSPGPLVVTGGFEPNEDRAFQMVNVGDEVIQVQVEVAMRPNCAALDGSPSLVDDLQFEPSFTVSLEPGELQPFLRDDDLSSPCFAQRWQIEGATAHLLGERETFPYLYGRQTHVDSLDALHPGTVAIDSRGTPVFWDGNMGLVQQWLEEPTCDELSFEAPRWDRTFSTTDVVSARYDQDDCTTLELEANDPLTVCNSPFPVPFEAGDLLDVQLSEERLDLVAEDGTTLVITLGPHGDLPAGTFATRDAVCVTQASCGSGMPFNLSIADASGDQIPIPRGEPTRIEQDDQTIDIVVWRTVHALDRQCPERMWGSWLLLPR